MTLHQSAKAKISIKIGSKNRQRQCPQILLQDSSENMVEKTTVSECIEM